MQIALTETFLDDFAALQQNLQKKSKDIISFLKSAEAKSLRNTSLPGWRIHKLQSSPFVSFSLDMNFRMLAKIEGETVFIHRVVKHSLADSPKVNRNDNEETPYNVTNISLKPNEIYKVLSTIGIEEEQILPLAKVETEDDLLNALLVLDTTIAEYSLALYETTGLIIPRIKYSILNSNNDFEDTLKGKQNEWEIYLHPSQTYVAKLPSDYRIAISGSAGTGKTVCAWHRLTSLAKSQQKTGFIAPNQEILKVSREKLEALTGELETETYFLVPNTPKDIIQLANQVDHLIIDEGQELPTGWYSLLSQSLKTIKRLGITIFYDLNQLGATYQLGDTRRFEYRIESFIPSITTIENIQFFDFHINYRNSREISTYYLNELKDHLPVKLGAEIPVFACGDVIVYKVKDVKSLPILIADAVQKLNHDFKPHEIGIIISKGQAKVIEAELKRLGIPISTDIASKTQTILTNAQQFRGHEKKAIIICKSKYENNAIKVGKAIDSYIGYSRARDRLIVFEI